MFNDEESIFDNEAIRDYYHIDSDAHLAYIEESNSYTSQELKTYPIYYFTGEEEE